MAGGVHGKGACVAGGMSSKGGMHGRGHAWQRACMTGGVRLIIKNKALLTRNFFFKKTTCYCLALCQ